jgi:hypothetical protein
MCALIDQDLHQLTGDLVSSARGVHALDGLALLKSGSGGGLGAMSQYYYTN